MSKNSEIIVVTTGAVAEAARDFMQKIVTLSETERVDDDVFNSALIELAVMISYNRGISLEAHLEVTRLAWQNL